jgi:hypothetical protein
MSTKFIEVAFDINLYTCSSTREQVRYHGTCNFIFRIGTTQKEYQALISDNMLLHKATRRIHNVVLKVTKQNHAFQAHIIYNIHNYIYTLLYSKLIYIFQVYTYSVCLKYHHHLK